MSKDIDELTRLNRDYVASVQNSDVKRFDEILAEDFYCSNPDKSLVDRAGFLKQTAVPVTIRNLEAHDVKIRVMGDFAIIHARTTYTTPDGKPASRRYAPTRWLGRDDVNLSIKNNDAAYRLAGFHRGKALVDLGQFQFRRDPVLEVQL